MKRFLCGAAIVMLVSVLNAQDSVDVAFRYTRSGVGTIFLVGEFNGWNNSIWPMTNIGNDVWTRTVRLRLGGNPSPPVGVPGAWQYKFYYSGASPWPNDPLNHHENPADNNNSYLYTKDPTIYQLLPNQRQAVVKTSTPTISAYIFPKVGATIDTASISITIDGKFGAEVSRFYDAVSKQLVYKLPQSLPNGSHTLILSAGTDAGGRNADTVTFTTQGGYVQITTQGGYSTRNPLRQIRGLVEDTSIHAVKVVRNILDTSVVPVIAGAYVATDTLTEGTNTFRAVVDTNGVHILSDSVTFTLLVDHRPNAKASISYYNASQIELSALSTTDPDGQAVTNFTWLDDPTTPLGLTGKTGATVQLPKPAAAGEYFYSLIATDPDGNSDTTRLYFIVKKDGTVASPTIASSPEWAKRARVYFLFPKSFSPEATIAGAAKRLQYIKDLGFNVIWVMPVMKNASPINRGSGPGYNIVDFYNVAPEYGSNDDCKNFVAEAHALGIKVILDVTPNHTSRFHPWSTDAHLFKQDSRYWTWYEHSIIPHNDNGLGQSLDADGFNYYSGFSEQLLNFNWRDVDARAEMINVYKYWIREFGLDGYRFDVYWGPHRRYGEQYMGKPVRDALKHIKPDILLLAEDDGTGSGTETIYGDYNSGGINGGVDAAYDFKLYFNQIRNFGFSPAAVTNLHSDLYNGGYYPGPNALYMRFMESQDEDRIVQFYSQGQTLDATTTFKRTMPMATVIFSAPGFPMIWNGQEIGWGYGISGSKEARNRSLIDWSYQGKTLLTPHYQRLAWIRGSYPTFASQSLIQVSTGNGLVYGFTRPMDNANAVVVANFNSARAPISIALNGGVSSPNVLFTGGVQDGKTYYMNDVYNDTSYAVVFSGGLANFPATLPEYGSAVYILADSLITLKVPSLTNVKDKLAANVLPAEFSLDQNYPNPFNPVTHLQFTTGDLRFVSLKIYDVLGREVATLVNERRDAGTYIEQFNAASLSTGVYFYKLTAGSFIEIKRMMLLK